MKTFSWFAIVMALCCTMPALMAEKHQPKPIEHAPLPAKVLTAKTIFIENESSQADLADNAYAQLKSWGRFQIVDSKEKADLILVLNVVRTQTEGTEPKFVSVYNSQNQSFSYGTVQTPTTNTWHYTQWQLVDPVPKEVQWADQRIWWRKHYPTEELAKSLRQRIEEQETKAAK